MNIGSEDEWIIQPLQNLDFYSPVSEVYWFYDCVQRRSNTKCSYNISADITNSLPASTGGTEGQKAKNKEDTENQNVPEKGGSEPEPLSRPAAPLRSNLTLVIRHVCAVDQ